jgi:hypothetical protein
MQANVTITLSDMNLYGADFINDPEIDHEASNDALVEQIEAAMAPDYDTTVVIDTRTDGATKVDGDITDDQRESILDTVNSICERSEWVVYRS